MISKTKYLHFKKLKGTSDSKLIFGNVGLQSLSNIIFTDLYIDLIKKLYLKKMKKKNKIYFRINCNKFITKKSNESRMGAGKGDFYKKGCHIKFGTILFELKTEITPILIAFFKELSYKLPLKVRIIYY